MSARGITKVYGATRALKGVDFDVRRGAVTVLFGENGAGKSTLMKILSGVESPTSGTLILDGEEIVLSGTVDAARRGIAIIHQELSLAPNLSIRDNIFMGRELVRGGLVVDDRAQTEKTRELMARLAEELDPDTLIEDLRLGQQQIVEVARALAGDARVLIMDEPTSALSGNEVEVLFALIRELTDAGVAIVYISHHLEEALEIADHAVVFRDGDLVATGDRDAIDMGWVVGHMVGRAADDLVPDLLDTFGDVALRLRDVTVADPSNPARLAVDGVDLDVRQGEIVCLYGLMGAGRTELLEALIGRIPVQKGTVEIEGRTLTRESVSERIDLGLALVPEDRQRDGLVQTMSVGENSSLSSLLRYVKGIWLHKRAEREAVDRGIGDVRVKTSSPAASITSLSGGNQQKVVIGKVLMTTPQVILLDEPSRGIDVGAKAEIFGLMAREARRGLAVLFATSEVNEALTVSNRIVVMSKGRIVRILDSAGATRNDLMFASGEASEEEPSGSDHR
ncbi:sugar ABC transporter ATP-binding protein [Microbacterium sp. EYE_5]|nr:sugar ABC transporter ATP-binding protein [Microbacterium sp. EYE_382]MCK6084559.1 sugar ABC transporter ATP-binding protein [Microbacterium sp. EYE_384]MCK6123212.1 sugar ABC transporter ATP-binding protein [Microbacterium sp. EYE_80]MCK6125323.1 sugar ABC transporter ATP-binding protein [Microbacterium sp. EYE_79]MCK6140243.1 sugar ABC transporter ATP-binding protein [Microbacterium sp. EYE_39]MCK6216970.1 sugar ABC transporter ATP-binding protein [Microbacterium sp. EYE_5]MCK6227543.1 s